MADTPSIKVVKSTLWRTGARLWSNRYHFDGGLPADTAAWTTLSDAIVTDEKDCLQSTKNHPIYLFTYIHNVLLAGNSTPDVLDTTHKTALEEYADDWLAGFSDGTLTHKRAGPRGAVAQSRVVETYVTHRDFPT